ncbi:site-specific integrase [Bacteroides caecicola]|uniref:site-specific integrase n=1 Tax=Bacteroides caecicola TaxID=1462569 RepID=UPI0015A94D91|nr:site-specific integrase [Bacteroides caecicola]MCL1625827.1 site-specific integrase [Bacteroides caecicola]
MGRKKKEIKMKEPVRIREKRLNDGNVSLYLDMYYMGARKKEGLKLYLIPEVNAAAKLQNRNTLKLAEQIKAERILDIQQHGLVNWESVKKGRMTLAAWVEKYTKDENGLTPASMRSKRNAQARVEQYLLYIGKPNLALKEVDKDFCKGFIAFLKTCTFNNGKKTLGSTTCRIFMNRLAAALNMAVREGLIDNNPFKLLDAKEKPQKKSAMREFLTIEELRTLIATPCRYEIVKKAFLFSCFTGLRYSDMMALKWNEIHKAADGKTLYIEHEQVKTKNMVTIPLSNEALKWMPRKSKGDERVFHQLRITSTTVEVVLGEWMQEAGIQKHITYHCSRHTAATLLLTLGADLYTVSKILGHRSIRMTEVYAKIVDKKKIETMNLVNNMFV